MLLRFLDTRKWQESISLLIVENDKKFFVWEKSPWYFYEL